jgi:hypothetical protein
MIDLRTEKLISFAEAPKHIPGRPHLSQVYRWSQRGLRGTKLEWLQVAGRRFTSLEALARFYASLTRAAGGEAAVPPPRVRRKQIAQAERELQEAGFEVGGQQEVAP